jgi:hypothetical protein
VVTVSNVDRSGDAIPPVLCPAARNCGGCFSLPIDGNASKEAGGGMDAARGTGGDSTEWIGMKCYIGKEGVPVQCVIMEKRCTPKKDGKPGFYCSAHFAGMGWQNEWNMSKEVYDTLPPEGEKVTVTLRLVSCRAQVNRGGKFFYQDLLEPEVSGVVVAGNRS